MVNTLIIATLILFLSVILILAGKICHYRKEITRYHSTIVHLICERENMMDSLPPEAKAKAVSGRFSRIEVESIISLLPQILRSFHNYNQKTN